MTLSAADEGLLAPPRPGFADTLSFSFADAAGKASGHVELRLGFDATGARSASAFALLFVGAELATAAHDGPTPSEADAWEDVTLAGISTRVDKPLASWSVGLQSAEGDGFELEFRALAIPAVLASGDPTARATSVEGYEHLCRVTGVVHRRRRAQEIDCLGQRGHRWGSVDAAGCEVVRHLGAWFEHDFAVLAAGARPSGAAGHDVEMTGAFLVEGRPALVARMADARLSTTYDAERHPLRVGLELWASDDAEFPRRLSGETICHATAEFAGRRVDCAFPAWHMEGRSGLGYYEVQRPA